MKSHFASYRHLPWWTWILPLPIFHLGTRIALHSELAPGIVTWYLPIGIGLTLVQWWGPRVLLAMYLNGLVSAPLWNIHNPSGYPLYAIPEVTAIFLSWLIYSRWCKGSPTIPNNRSLLCFYLLAVIPAAGLGDFLLVGLFEYFGKVSSDLYLPTTVVVWATDCLGALAITIPVLTLLSPYLQKKGWIARYENEPNSIRITSPIPYAKTRGIEMLLACVLILVLCTTLNVQRNWLLVGLVLVGVGLRHGVRMAMLANTWLVSLLLVLPFIRPEHFGGNWSSNWETARFFFSSILVMVSALAVSRTVSDYQEEIQHRFYAEQATRENEARLSLAMESSNMGAWDWDLEQDILHWSPQMCALIGLEKRAREVELIDFVKRIPPADYSLLKSNLQRTSKGIDSQFKAEYRMRNEVGELRWFETVGQVYRNAEGHPTRLMGITTDITERKWAAEKAQVQEQQLLQADKMKSVGIMASGVAHEINNPNNLIMLNADVIRAIWIKLRKKIPLGAEEESIAGMPVHEAMDKFEKLLDGVTTGSLRIKSIVQGMKDFARADQGEAATRIEIQTLFESTLMLIGNLIRKSTHHFEIKIADGTPPVHGNFQRLEQVLVNLITNACQALPDAEKAIRLSASFDTLRKEVILEVRDEGGGIQEEDMKKIFDPFFTTKRSTGGTGLGLSISYNIIKEHGGTLEFESKWGQGTCARIILPADASFSSRKPKA